VLADTPSASTTATNLIAGTATKYLVLALNIASGIVLMPFTVRHLGQTQYGLWMLVASMTTYFQLLDLGYGNGVVRHLVDADRRGDSDEVNRIASTFVCVYAIIAAVACLAVAAMIVVVVPRFPHLTGPQVRIGQAILAILGARVAIGFPLTVFGAVTNARQGFVLNNLVAAFTVAASALCTYVVLSNGYGLVTLVATTAAVNIAGYGGYAWIAYRVMPTLRIRPRYFSLARWRDVTTFSVYLFVIQLAGQISFNIDNVVVGAFMGPALVAVYTIALRLAEYQRRLCDQFSGMLFPVVMAFGAAGDRSALKRTLVEGNRVGLTLVAGASVCLIGFSDQLIRRWMGPGFDGSIVPFVILAAAGIVVVSQAASANVLIAVGDHRLVAWIWIGEAAANLVLSLLLVRPLGLAGVALGTLLPLIVGHLVVMQSTACRRVGASIVEGVFKMTKPAFVAGACASLSCVAIRMAHPPTTSTVVIAEAALVGAVYVAALVTIGFDGETRRAYRAQLCRVWNDAVSALARAAATATARPSTCR
jgi:O-antigen/teichoic acid export membrane protein